MSEYSKDPFFQVSRATLPTSVGDADVPVLYYDVSCMIAMFRVDYRHAAKALGGMGLKPGLRFGSKAIAGLAFYEYRDTSIGPYNEVGLALPAVPQHMPRPVSGWLDLYGRLNSRRVGFYILDLPVTTPIAWAAGCELWGYPKFVTQLPFRLDGKSFHGQVMHPEDQEPILTLSGKLGIGIPAPPMSLALYSQLAGKKLRSTVNVRGGVKLRPKGGLRLSVGSSDHVMARNLRDLGMHGLQPLLVMDTHRFQSRLNIGEEVSWPSS